MRSTRSSPSHIVLSTTRRASHNALYACVITHQTFAIPGIRSRALGAAAFRIPLIMTSALLHARNADV
jgi:hypothetical protein